MEYDALYVGEIALTDEGKKYHDAICEELRTYCKSVVSDNATDRITFRSNDYIHYNELKEYVIGLSEVGYITEARIDIDKACNICDLYIRKIKTSDKKEKENGTGTKTISITAYPYAVQYGEIKVPKDLPLEKIQDYIRDHWNEISFGEPKLDYCGTDFEFDED